MSEETKKIIVPNRPKKGIDAQYTVSLTTGEILGYYNKMSHPDGDLYSYEIESPVLKRYKEQNAIGEATERVTNILPETIAGMEDWRGTAGASRNVRESGDMIGTLSGDCWPNGCDGKFISKADQYDSHATGTPGSGKGAGGTMWYDGDIRLQFKKNEAGREHTMKVMFDGGGKGPMCKVEGDDGNLWNSGVQPCYSVMHVCFDQWDSLTKIGDEYIGSFDYNITEGSLGPAYQGNHDSPQHSMKGFTMYQDGFKLPAFDFHTGPYGNCEQMGWDSCGHFAQREYLGEILMSDGWKRRYFWFRLTYGSTIEMPDRNSLGESGYYVFTDHHSPTNDTVRAGGDREWMYAGNGPTLCFNIISLNPMTMYLDNFYLTKVNDNTTGKKEYNTHAKLITDFMFDKDPVYGCPKQTWTQGYSETINTIIEEAEGVPGTEAQCIAQNGTWTHEIIYDGTAYRCVDDDSEYEDADFPSSTDCVNADNCLGSSGIPGYVGACENSNMGSGCDSCDLVFQAGAGSPYYEDQYYCVDYTMDEAVYEQTTVADNYVTRKPMYECEEYYDYFGFQWRPITHISTKTGDDTMDLQRYYDDIQDKNKASAPAEVTLQFSISQAGDNFNIIKYPDRYQYPLREWQEARDETSPKNFIKYLQFSAFVVNWDWKEGEPDTINEIKSIVPTGLSELTEVQKKQNIWNPVQFINGHNYQIMNHDATKAADMVESAQVPHQLNHTYQNAGLKIIKYIVYSYFEHPQNPDFVKLVDWRLGTARLNLNIHNTYEQEFQDIGGWDYKYIPWPYTSPVIGGISDESQYIESLNNVIKKNEFSQYEYLDKELATLASYNDELGKFFGQADIEQVRYFKKPFDLNHMLLIDDRVSEQGLHPSTPEYIGNTNLFSETNIYGYWDGTNNQFPEETSIGQIFINKDEVKVPYYTQENPEWTSDNINKSRLKDECLIEINGYLLTGTTIRDTSGNGNKGILIGDYSLTKQDEGIPVSKDSSIDIPDANAFNESNKDEQKYGGTEGSGVSYGGGGKKPKKCG